MSRNQHTQHRRARRTAVAIAASGAVGIVAFAVTAAGDPAGAAKVTPPTTIVQSSGHAERLAAGPLADAARTAVTSAWPDANFDSVVDVDDGTRSRVDLTGSVDGQRFTATLFRYFSREELDGSGSERRPSKLGTTWVGATDEDLTSVYHLSDAGVGIRVGLEPRLGAKAASVDEVQVVAETIAANHSAI